MKSRQFVTKGMPALEKSARTVSFFEFWPGWLMYTPVAIQWVFLAIRHRSLTLPFIANPKLAVSGMVGVPKSELMCQAVDECESAILDWDIHILTTDEREHQVEQWLQRLGAKGVSFPFVCKPDIGCRGSGVKLIQNKAQLVDVMGVYPVGAGLMGQRLAAWEPEAGVFYVRNPGEAKGKVVSLTLKYSPYVIGDGERTLGQLVDDDERARQLLSIYKDRHLDNWQTVIADGETYRLVFSASHCRGAIFTDARQHITPELCDSIDIIMKGLPEFYYGRLDVKFSDLDRLKQGADIEIVEINGASAESIHIWDKNASFLNALGTLMWQYRTLFYIGSLNRKRGYKTPGLRKVLRHWKKERALAEFYPSTD